MLPRHAPVRPSRHPFRLGSLSATLPRDTGYRLKMARSFKNDCPFTLMNAVICGVRRARAYHSSVADYVSYAALCQSLRSLTEIKC
jgi:hypothetical protein